MHIYTVRCDIETTDSMFFSVLTKSKPRDEVCQAKSPKDKNSVYTLDDVSKKTKQNIYSPVAMQTKEAARVFCSLQMCTYASCATHKKTTRTKLCCNELFLPFSFPLKK